MNTFQLIETMRVSETGEVSLLERHLDRLNRSARYFSFNCDIAEVRQNISRAAAANAAVCLRLLLSNSGAMNIESSPLPASRPAWLILSDVRVNSDDVFLRHKTTNRSIYEMARKRTDAQ